MKILFITTANLVTNPRLLKELRLLSRENNCTLLGFNLGNWSDQLEPKIRASLPEVDFRYLSATRNPFTPWMLSSIVLRLARLLIRWLPQAVSLQALSIDKRSWLLRQELKRMHPSEYDLVIAHNMGALYPAYRFSQKSKTPFGFDVEDFHPGEEGITKEQYKADPSAKGKVLHAILPKANYVTFASPLIAKEINQLCNYQIKKGTVINNVFSEREFKEPREIKNPKLQLVWYSQNIDQGRGLELIIQALEGLEQEFHLTLIGALSPSFGATWINDRSYITCLQPMNQKDLHLELAKFDIGLALEDATLDFNRDLCLTNKLWAYYQAGLYIFATDTLAQSKFIKENQENGKIVRNCIEDVRHELKVMSLNKTLIKLEKNKRYRLGKKYSWENESEKWLKIINE